MFSWLLDKPIPSIRSELKADPGATRADGRCRHCNGQLWNSGYIVICESCSTIIENTETLTSNDLWKEFHEKRSKHWNSNAPRCVGGFPHAYDWVDSDDIERSIREISPDEFYK